VKLRYIGEYDGIEPSTGKMCKRSEVYDFPDDVAKKLLFTSQFVEVEAEPHGGE